MDLSCTADLIERPVAKNKSQRIKQSNKPRGLLGPELFSFGVESIIIGYGEIERGELDILGLEH
jgi:hypothetical protein